MKNNLVTKLLPLLIVLTGCSEKQYKFYDDVGMLVDGENASAFSHRHDVKSPEKAFADVKIEISLINCLKSAKRDANPGIFDRELVIHTNQSNVFIKFYFEKKKLKFVQRGYLRDDSLLLQSGGAVFSVPCKLSDWPVVERLYIQ